MGSNRKFIKTFTASNKGIRNIKLQGGGNPGIPQSMCVLPGSVVAVFHNQNNSGHTAHCRKYTKKNGYIKGSDTVNHSLGHCNGATYCDKDGMIYCTGYNNGSQRKQIVVLNQNFKQQRTFNLPVGVSGVAYDKSVNKFYCTSGKNIYIFSYSEFTKSSGKKSYKHFRKAAGAGGKGQDVAGYNGIIYKLQFYSSHGIIDLYKHTTGAYIGTIKITYSETESAGFDYNGNFIYLTANQRRSIHFTDWAPTYKDLGSGGSASPSSGGGTKGTAAQKFVEVAKKEIGTKETGTNRQKYGEWFGSNGVAWCAIFVSWCCHKAFGNNNIIPKNANAYLVAADAVGKGGKWIKKASRGPTTHVGIVASVKNGKATTVEGNYSDKVGSRTINVPSGTAAGDLIVFYGGSVGGIARPNWPGGEYSLDGSAEGEYGSADELILEVHPEQLYSSDNYKYLEEQEETEEQKALKARQQATKQFLSSINVSSIEKPAVIPDIILPNIQSASNFKKPQTKVSGNISGSYLPCTVNYVEAPYGKITLGGVTIGSYTNKNYPNYLNSINTVKTNGSLNEYTINLTHQIYPGDNPNYIDNLISQNGYNKIQIEYGDAEAGVAYRDINALLVNAKSNFDFFNNRINYTLQATSSSIMSSINRRNYSSVTAKPSTIINKMLYETGELLYYFPGMADRSFVNSNNLIPSNDMEVYIDAVTNTTPLNYMNKLVSYMTPITSKDNKLNDSIYYMNIDDNSRNESYFRIKQIKTNLSASAFPFMYEVDINYPDENSLVYNFSVDTDFNWPLAYEYAGGFTTYDYDIDNAGKVSSKQLTSNIKSIASTKGANITDKNWWTNVTEFPVKATLEVKGLTTYTLLLNYIKVNVFYFGQKRNSSGVYIVTGQEDSLSGNGFKTKLSLLRVAGDDQYITVDGRVLT